MEDIQTVLSTWKKVIKTYARKNSINIEKENLSNQLILNIYNRISSAILGNIFLKSDSFLDIILIILITKHFSLNSRKVLLITRLNQINIHLVNLGLDHLVILGKNPESFSYCLVIENSDTEESNLQIELFGQHIKDNNIENIQNGKLNSNDGYQYILDSLHTFYTNQTMNELFALTNIYSGKYFELSNEINIIFYGDDSSQKFLWQYFWIKRKFPDKKVNGIYLDMVMDEKVKHYEKNNSNIYTVQLDENIGENLHNIVEKNSINSVQIFFFDIFLINEISIRNYFKVFYKLFEKETVILINKSINLDDKHQLDKDKVEFSKLINNILLEEKFKIVPISITNKAIQNINLEKNQIVENPFINLTHFTKS